MYIKHQNSKVVCTMTDDKNVMTALPTCDIVMDDSVPWEFTDKEYIRVDDSFVELDSSEYIDILKTREIAALTEAFASRVAGSFTTTQGYKMQFDTTDAIKMEGAIKLLEATGATEGYLTQADDTTVHNVPLDTMKAVLIEMMAAFAACHARKQELRALINSAKTAEDLDEIVISWPV